MEYLYGARSNQFHILLFPKQGQVGGQGDSGHVDHFCNGAIRVWHGRWGGFSRFLEGRVGR